MHTRRHFSPEGEGETPELIGKPWININTTYVSGRIKNWTTGEVELKKIVFLTHSREFSQLWRQGLGPGSVAAGHCPSPDTMPLPWEVRGWFAWSSLTWMAERGECLKTMERYLGDFKEGVVSSLEPWGWADLSRRDTGWAWPWRTGSF